MTGKKLETLAEVVPYVLHPSLVGLRYRKLSLVKLEFLSPSPYSDLWLKTAFSEVV